MSYTKKMEQLVASIQQQNRMLKLSFPDNNVPFANQMVANHIVATENFNQDFEFKIEILADSIDIPLKEMIGKMATVEMKRFDGSSRFFNGYIFSFKFLKNDGAYVRYEMVLKPWLAFLKYRQDCQIFQEKTLKDRSSRLFEKCINHDVAWNIRGEDPETTFSVQFNESDYNYLQRQWEAAGWIYWYEHRKDGHTLHIIDQSTTTNSIQNQNQELIWRGNEAHNTGVGVISIADQSQMSFSKYTASSFDFKSPDPLQAEFSSSHALDQLTDLENYTYSGAYGFKDFDQGKNDLVSRSQADFALNNQKFMVANDAYAEIGHWFKLSRTGGEEKEYLVTGIQHSAGNNYLFETERETAQYRCEMTCIQRDVPWKPILYLNSQMTRIYGLQTAIVVGPLGEEIYTDKYGRVKVQFHWDRLGKKNEESSAWVRVATAWAGSNFGMVSIPRIGQEVIVQFLEGNPDRPIITGSVYNEDNLPPWDLPNNATQSGILSRSSTGATIDNANAIRFEDKKGAEEVWIHAEKDQRIEVENNESHSVGVDRSKTVGSNETVSIGADRTETVGNNETISIGVNRTETVGSNETINIGANRTETVTGNETITIQQNRTKTVVANENANISQNQSVSVAQNQSTSVGQNQTVNVGLNKVESVAVAKALNVGAAYAVTVGAGHALTVAGAMNTAVGLAQFEQVGLAKNVSVGNSYNIDVADKFELQVGSASLVLKSDGTITISGVKILIEGETLVQINGNDVDIN
ncbi:type VI secretion system tip protein TssI/VgrG [Acinetobacter bereziniae]|uniref:type VI secretion system Vgr family protein n=1 Tax=Acinetobacter bereziniae TaxID=106648 RepID=UPI0028130D6A|nr:type VI secretion system tip protein TssI/VgrG [Acinetobacter bereziniae]MDQ9818895.1 type VI secretion system tip protein TssI/VgrG [Acinetobacter bereziniae]